MPPVSPAATIATYSSLKIFGCRASASANEMPASTSMRTCVSASWSLSFSACSSSTYSARRSDMPDEIIVDSWRVATVSSCAFTRLKRAMMSPTSLEPFFSTMSTTIRPLARSCEATCCLFSASTSPRVDTPDRSSALKVKVLSSVAMALGDPHRAHQAAQLLGRAGPGLGQLAADLLAADEVGERRVHRLHAVGPAGLERRVDLVALALADQVAHGRRGDEHLAGADTALAVDGRQQLLGDDALQGDRQLRADLVLLLRRERVDDAVDGLRRVLGVKRREDQVAGLGRGQRGLHRLQVAHLADEDHVRVLAEGRLERLAEALRVGAQLALVDDAALVAVQELDRVLDRHDVLVPRLVDLVDHRRERRRLARAGRPGDEHEAARLLDEVHEDRRQAERLERRDVLRDRAHDRADRRALEEGVDAEAGLAGHRVGEVDLPLLLELLALVVVEERVHDLAADLRGHRCVVQRAHPAADADHRRGARRQVEVRGAEIDGLEQHVREIEVHIPSIGSGWNQLTRATSAMDVTPSRTFSRPSSRSRRMPC